MATYKGIISLALQFQRVRVHEGGVKIWGRAPEDAAESSHPTGRSRAE